MSDSGQTKKILKIGLPKGSLQDSTLDIFRRAGFNISVDSRSYFPSINDPELQCVMFRAQEISRYVEDGVIDMGLTGYDWICENDSHVVEVCELIYSKVSKRPARWVLAVPAESPVTKVEDLEGGIIATELVNVTRKFFSDRGVNVKVEFSWGATEVKARLLSGIVDVTETGSSLRANNLKVLAEVLESTPRLIVNTKTWDDPWKRTKVENIAMLLKGAIDAAFKIGLKMNVPESGRAEILKLLPAEKSPTISPLAEKGWCAVEVILEEIQERELIPQLKRAGATGIITYALNKVIP
ncbi:MAG: ATP phosphoribosyltransferase [Phycisphaerae bacterium]